jgi:hypothetical protein
MFQIVCNDWTLSGSPWLQPGGQAEQSPHLAGTRAAGHRQTVGRLQIDERALAELSSARLCHIRRQDDCRGRAGDEVALAHIAAERTQVVHFGAAGELTTVAHDDIDTSSMFAT